jgi:uncharacterized protein
VSALVWFFRIIVLLLVLRFVLRLLFGSRPVVRRQPMPPNPGSQERIGGELVRDPNCGTHIPKARAIAVGTGADIKYFCSTKCRDEYAARN